MLMRNSPPGSPKIWINKLSKATKNWMRSYPYIGRISAMNTHDSGYYLWKLEVNDIMTKFIGVDPCLDDGEQGFMILNSFLTSNYMDGWGT